ncbi:MAG: response regulator [Bacteroidetes bacterium]|nr:response regulator [Bacteroidota bacterium]
MTKKVRESEKLTVLFASGDEYLKERVLEVLDKDRHHVVVADNCKDALEKLLDSDFDAIIFDHDLKELDSTDTMQLIKKIRPKLPLIVLSEAISYESEVKIAKLGVHFRLNKPLDEEVTKALFESLERRGEKNN